MAERQITWEEVMTMLGGFYSPDEADRWARTPQQALSGKSPKEAWEAPEGREWVLQIFYEMEGGAFL